MKRFIKFCITGTIGAIFNLLIFCVLNFSGVNYIISSFFAFIISAKIVYEINLIYTFKDRNLHKSKKLWFKFIFFSTITLGINLLTLYLSKNYLFPSLNNCYFFKKSFETAGFLLKIDNIKVINLLSQCMGIGVATIFNFFGNNFITFKNK